MIFSFISIKQISTLMVNRILFILVLLTTLYSCDNDPAALMPNVTGKAGEVVIVVDNAHWSSAPGNILKEKLGHEVSNLPQYEPFFDLVHIPSSAFSDIFKTHRNIIITRISSNVKKAKITIRKDVYAKPQIIIKIEARDKKEFVKIMENNGFEVRDKILEKEKNRIIRNYKKYEEIGISERLRKFHNLSLNFPRGYTYDMDTSNFIWISHETPKISQGVFIYYYNYLDTTDFNKENLIAKRDLLLKRYVQGPVENTYMTTEKNLPIQYKEFLMNDKYATKLEGLWKLEGPAFMGGPFVSISIVDEERNRIITADAYIYVPKYENRNYIRQVEAILYTLKIIKENTIKE